MMKIFSGTQEELEKFFQEEKIHIQQIHTITGRQLLGEGDSQKFTIFYWDWGE